ncbi:putative MFS multidrug transporter [Rhizodiscina lignyota]|uniref:MFS multidrug transporter n=1 Tax=Rhizodiscina lignyota TaxID=1504668 RepID=A0A9P4MA39_9PEZI|nr:putative MFS multidrug transporter [Rhizodiscina lignyota]
MSADPVAAVTELPSEQRPLLGDSREQVTDNGTIERQPADDAEQQDSGDAAPLAEEPDTTKLALIMGSMWLGVIMNAMDSTIVATLTAPISTSFNSFKLLSWLATAYLISNAACQPLSGRLTDIFGRRTGLIWSNTLFAVGNLICGLAKSEGMIIIGRVIAGMGGGGVNTISTFVASDLVPLRRRGLWQGYGNLCYGLGSGIGGVFGGWINDTIGWRWAFLVQVPVIVTSGILVAFNVKIPVKETDKSRIRRVDFLGAFTLVLSLVLLLLGLNSGGNIVPWDHPLVLVSLSLAFVCLLAFIYVEDRVAAEPIIPVRLLLNRTVLSACLTNWFSTMAVYSLLYYGPIYFQALGLSTTAAGARLIPTAIGTAVGSLGAGWIMRHTGRYWWLSFGTQACLVLSASLIAATMNERLSAWPVFIYFFLGGTGHGGMLTVTLLALISAVDHKDQAVVTSASYAFRSTGSTIGITVSSAVFQNLLNQLLWARFGDRPDAAKIIPRIRDSIDEIKRLPPDWKVGVVRVYMEALRGVWVTILGIAVLAALSSLFMREHILHKTLARK